MKAIKEIIFFLKLIRWTNLLMIVFIQYALYYALIDRIYTLAGVPVALTYGNLTLLVITTVLIAAAGYIINDLSDIEADKVNKPGRQIIPEFINEKVALNTYTILNIIAAIIGFYLAWLVGSWRLGFVFPMIMILLWLYSTKYKNSILWGNIAVAFMSAMVVILVWLFEFFMLRKQPDSFIAMTPFLGMITRYFAFYALFAFILTFLREVIKDAEDIEGDKSAGFRTLAVEYGISASKKVALVTSVLSVLFILGTAVLFFNEHMIVAGLYFILAILFPVVYLFFKIYRATEKSDFRLLSNLIKILMLAGLIGLQPIVMSLV